MKSEQTIYQTALKKNEPKKCFRIERIVYQRNAEGSRYLVIRTEEHSDKVRHFFVYTIHQTLEEFAQNIASLYF